ncbi:MAG: AtuA-related protein [Pseudolabrys sp.]
MNAPRRNARQIVRDIAHARAGDKGNISNVSVWAYDAADYELLKRTLTSERIKQTFPHLIRGKVDRYEMPHLNGLNFVLHDALEGGVNASLNLDSHGKSWSYLLLGLELDGEPS